MADKIRLASITDSEEILEIYAPYVQNTAISFEIEVPTIQEFSKRIENICKQYPYLVYMSNNKIVAYAYASKHRERAAYCYNVDVSVYASLEYHGKGIARRLYKCLFAILMEQGYYSAYAGYTVPNEKSMKFHEKFGFTYVGTYEKVGYKLEEWYDVTWMGKTITDYTQKPKPLKSMSELPEEFIQNILNMTFAK